MASADLREELTCPICLSIYTDPVTLSCGHNYCLRCIKKTWDNQDEGEYSCPECQHRFRRRPELKSNLRLRNIAENIQPTEPVKETGILCTYCIYPAAKSCLLCEASLCDAHLRVHSKSEEHILTEPTTSWGNRKCSIHKELLKYYCTEDSACICASCSLAGEHRGHQVELLNEASEKKKKRLRIVLRKLATKREKAENGIQQLKKEKDELTRKMSYIEELYNMTDPLTVLQEQESHRDDFCGAEKGDNEVTQRGDKQVPAGGDLDEGLTLYRGLTDNVHDVKRGLYMQVTSDILLDRNTAGNNVIVSGDLKTASYSRIDQQRPERFTDAPQVVSTRSFSSGQHYWEVQTSKSGEWRVGVCYPSMGRTGWQSVIGENNKSWCLHCCNKDLSVIHGTIGSSLTPPLSFTRVGIVLDYEAGRLTFYELCDPMRHLHTFTATFTEPLHASFWVWDDGAWVRILH